MAYYVIEKSIILDERKDTFFIGDALDGNFDKIKIRKGGFKKGGKSLVDILMTPISFVVNERNSFYGNYHEVLYTSSNIGQILLYNEDLKSSIEKKCPNDVEFFQVHIKGKKIDSKEYYAMNILNRIDCLDIEKSKCTEDYGFYTDFKTVVLDQEKIPKGLNIFRIDKTFPTFPPVITEEVVRIFMERKVHGAKFTVLENFKGG